MDDKMKRILGDYVTQAAEAERTAIAAWLRSQCTGRLQSPVFQADEIEAGVYKIAARPQNKEA